MQIHKEGLKVLFYIFLLIVLLNLVIYCLIPLNTIGTAGVLIVSLLSLTFFVRFFRKPNRSISVNDNLLISPADGTIVVIEETEEPEYFKDKRLQLSIFMSVWDVHINWYPVAGEVTYFRHHAGKYLVAKLPKSSTENERTTTVLKMQDGKEILVRQIAGAVARRIVPYPKEGVNVNQCDELGFIRFGSRVDIFLPLGTTVNAKIGEHVTGTQSILAEFKS